LARSKPIVVTCMWTAPHVIRLTTITLRHFGAGERAPSTTSKAPPRVLPQLAGFFFGRRATLDLLWARGCHEIAWPEAIAEAVQRPTMHFRTDAMQINTR
jgi:hypothetical protein